MNSKQTLEHCYYNNNNSCYSRFVITLIIYCGHCGLAPMPSSSLLTHHHLTHHPHHHSYSLLATRFTLLLPSAAAASQGTRADFAALCARDIGCSSSNNSSAIPRTDALVFLRHLAHLVCVSIISRDPCAVGWRRTGGRDIHTYHRFDMFAASLSSGIPIVSRRTLDE